MSWVLPPAKNLDDVHKKLLKNRSCENVLWQETESQDICLTGGSPCAIVGCGNPYTERVQGRVNEDPGLIPLEVK